MVSPLRTFRFKIGAVVRAEILACSRGKIVAGAWIVSCTSAVSARATFTVTMGFGGASSGCVQPTRKTVRTGKSRFIGLLPPRDPREQSDNRLERRNSWFVLGQAGPGPPPHRGLGLLRPHSAPG